jgi:hypothetical protein
MDDLLFLGLTVAFFAVSLAYVAFCERLRMGSR